MTEFILHRHEDISGVSGTGAIAEGVEFSDGAVALRWRGEHPFTVAWEDIRDMEAIHGHQGATEVRYTDNDRLLAAYARVVPFLLEVFGRRRPVLIAPHPDHPDRLRLVFDSESAWGFWIAALDGSFDAAVHVEFNGEIEHRWTSPDGNLWLTYYSPTQTPGTAWERHDDPEMTR